MPVKDAERPWEIIELLAHCPATNRKDSKELPIIHRNYLNAYDVKKAKSVTMHCECLYPARIIASSFSPWLMTQIFPGRDPRNSSRKVCVLLCPQNPQKLKRFWRIYSYRIQNIKTGSKNISNCSHLRIIFHAVYELFTLHWKLTTTVDVRKPSFRVWIYLYQVWNINAGSKLFATFDNSEDFIHIRSFLLPRLYCLKLFVPDLNMRWIQVTDWFHKLKSYRS